VKQADAGSAQQEAVKPARRARASSKAVPEPQAEQAAPAAPAEQAKPAARKKTVKTAVSAAEPTKTSRKKK
jgi:hypothetical protein